MYIVYAIFIGLAILLIWLLTRKKPEEGLKMSQSEYEELYRQYEGRGVLMPKVDTRFDKRWDYICTLYLEFRRLGFTDITSKVFVSHALRAQRGWKDPNPGKLWNFNCFGIKVGPTWGDNNPYFIAGTVEVDKYGKRYPTTSAWRSYRNASHSVSDYLKTIRQDRYISAFQYAEGLSGSFSESDAFEFAALLKAGGYFTGTYREWGQKLYNNYHNIESSDVRNHCREE